MFFSLGQRLRTLLAGPTPPLAMFMQNQLTPFTCGLACIESVSVDFGQPISQPQMLIRYKRALIAEATDGKNFGATSNQLMQQIWQDLGFKGEWKRNHHITEIRENVLGKLQPKQAILISSFFQRTAFHCCRYFGMKDNDTIFALVPLFYEEQPRMMDIALSALVEWDFEYALISV